MIHEYPSHILVYWRNEQSGQLSNAVQKLFNESPDFNKKDANLIRGYLKHWTSFRGHYFSSENDRQTLLKEIEFAYAPPKFFQIIDELLTYGIDPF